MTGVKAEAVVILRNESGISWEQLRANARECFGVDDSQIQVEQVLVIRVGRAA